MTARLLEGRQRAKQLQSELSERFAEAAAASGVEPTMAALQVGEDSGRQAICAPSGAPVRGWVRYIATHQDA